jgi:hypothetical protein
VTDRLPEDDERDACCPTCGSLFHGPGWHEGDEPAASADPAEFDPAEADRLIGRDPRSGQSNQVDLSGER